MSSDDNSKSHHRFFGSKFGVGAYFRPVQRYGVVDKVQRLNASVMLGGVWVKGLESRLYAAVSSTAVRRRQILMALDLKRSV